MDKFKPTNTVIRWEVRYRLSETGRPLFGHCENRQQARHLKNALKRNLWSIYDQVQIYRVEEQTFQDGSMLAVIEKAR
ncbi:MAG: hypothetical protein ACRC6V_08675 [Bacteroidales bacterium]